MILRTSPSSGVSPTLFKDVPVTNQFFLTPTRPETTIFAPKNGWLEYDPFLLGFGLFSGAMLVSERVIKLLRLLYLWFSSGIMSCNFLMSGLISTGLTPAAWRLHSHVTTSIRWEKNATTKQTPHIGLVGDFTNRCLVVFC